MEVVGGVTGILALVETGFSLAKALNTYISDVSDSRDDLTGLCSDIDSTFRNLKELALVIQQNEQTQAWSENGLANARKCAHDADVVVKKMRKLVQKGGVSVLAPAVEADQIDIQKFRRFLWPMYKGELEVRRRELQAIKLDIVIAYTSYNAKAADTSTARQQAENDLPRLQYAKATVRKDLKKARRNRRSRNRSPDRHVRYHSPPDIRRAHSKGSTWDAASNTSSDVYGVPGEIVYECLEDVYKDFEIWQKQKEEKKRAAQAERKKIQDEAVEKWKAERREEAEKQRAEIQAHRSRVQEELTRQQMAPQRIEEILNQIYPFPSSEYLTIPQTTTQTDIDSLVSSRESDRTETRSVWTRLSRKSSVSSNTKRNSIIPSLLQDPTSPGGLAQLKAIYFQRMLGPEGERIQQIDVDIPEQWLLQKILYKDARDRKGTKNSSIWRDFAHLPDDYRYCITNELKRKQLASTNAQTCEEWVLIYAEAQKRDSSRRNILNSKRSDVIGVYIVLKKVPRAHQTLLAGVTTAKEPEENPQSIKVDKISTEVPQPTADPVRSESNVSFLPEPQHAASYTPREQLEPEPIQLRHASRKAQSVNDQSILGDHHSRSRSPIPPFPRKARFSDDPVTDTAYVDEWDNLSRPTASRSHSRARSDYINPAAPLVVYPTASRSSSRKRSSTPNASLNDFVPRYRPHPDPAVYDPYPPPPDPYYLDRDRIVVDTLGTAWDNRRRSSLDSEASFDSFESYRHRRPGTYDHRRHRYSAARGSKFPAEPTDQLTLRTENRKTPGYMFEPTPLSRQDTFDSQASQPEIYYDRHGRLLNSPERVHRSQRGQSPPAKHPSVVIRRSDRSRSPEPNPLWMTERSRPLDPNSYYGDDDDVLSLSSYDAGDVEGTRTRRRTAEQDRKIGQSMLDNLTNKNVHVPLNSSKPKDSASSAQPAPVFDYSNSAVTIWHPEQSSIPQALRFEEMLSENLTPLEQARMKLERLNNKKAIAEQMGDILTASDLQYYAVPDQVAKIQQLEEEEILNAIDRTVVENNKREGNKKKQVASVESDAESHGEIGAASGWSFGAPTAFRAQATRKSGNAFANPTRTNGVNHEEPFNDAWGVWSASAAAAAAATSAAASKKKKKKKKPKKSTKLPADSNRNKNAAEGKTGNVRVADENSDSLRAPPPSRRRKSRTPEKEQTQKVVDEDSSSSTPPPRFRRKKSSNLEQEQGQGQEQIQQNAVDEDSSSSLGIPPPFRRKKSRSPEQEQIQQNAVDEDSSSSLGIPPPFRRKKGRTPEQEETRKVVDEDSSSSTPPTSSRRKKSRIPEQEQAQQNVNDEDSSSSTPPPRFRRKKTRNPEPEPESEQEQTRDVNGHQVFSDDTAAGSEPEAKAGTAAQGPASANRDRHDMGPVLAETDDDDHVEVIEEISDGRPSWDLYD